ncbi:hypothetical protein Taro_015045 [Colocasia esculenta]|uniref:Uncharacterized protein n=1 Tax=Colocasia esculenta TaxID=4460 RepID=A0A843UNR3_COLES|nr:hypothetical protein [Colocasia esculenta]
MNEDQPPVVAQVYEPFSAPHSPQLQSSSMNLEPEIPFFSPPPPVQAFSSFGGPSVPPELYTFLNDKFDALNTSIQSMSENFELRIQRLENSVSARFIEQKAASDHATQRFNRLISTLADASVDLKEHQEKLETVLQGILANSQADVFNTKRTNISCQGSVDTTILGVDTLTQSKGRNVDTGSSQVDTRDLSQGFDLPVLESVSTHLMGRSTHSGISVT